MCVHEFVLVRHQIRVNTRAAGQTAVHFKVPLGRALTQSGHSDAVMASSENMTSQPNVLHDREWYPRTADLAETGSLLPRAVR